MNREFMLHYVSVLNQESYRTLSMKSEIYSETDDALRNFRIGASILGGTPAQACWGYLVKHLASLRDRIERSDFSNIEDFMEKCQDSINYICLLWCIGNEMYNEINEKGDTNNE